MHVAASLLQAPHRRSVQVVFTRVQPCRAVTVLMHLYGLLCTPHGGGSDLVEAVTVTDRCLHRGLLPLLVMGRDCGQRVLEYCGWRKGVFWIHKVNYHAVESPGWCTLNWNSWILVQSLKERQQHWRLLSGHSLGLPRFTPNAELCGLQKRTWVIGVRWKVPAAWNK